MEARGMDLTKPSPTPDLPTSNPPQTPGNSDATMADPDTNPTAAQFGSDISLQHPPSKRKRHAVSSQPIFNQDQESGEDKLKTLLEHQTKLMHTLYNGIWTSNAEVVNKQDAKINKLTNSVQQNSTILDYLLEALDIQSVKSKDMDIDREERHQGDSDTTGTTNAKNKPDGNHTDADDPGDSTQETPFSYASKKKGSPCSGAVKHRPQQELKNKETIRQWFNEVMEGKDLYKNEVFDEEAKKFAEKFKLDLLARPCTVDNFRYWIAGVPKSAWNKGASYVLIDIPVKKRLITKPNIKARDALREAFFVQLKMLHGIWLEKQKMLEDKNLPHAVFAKRWQRKNTLFQQRRNVILVVPALEPYLEDFDELGVVKMSSNKEEPDMDEASMCYNIKEPCWRSQQLKNWVRLLDYCHLEGPSSFEGPQFGFTRGAAPRLCMDNNDKSSKSRYVVGLPAHFYNAEWLEKQEPGWAKGGTGFVNELVHPCAPRKLVFPADLARTLEQGKSTGKFIMLKKALDVAGGGFPPAILSSKADAHISEPSDVLKILFQYVAADGPTLGHINFFLLLRVAEAAEKYEMYQAIAAMRPEFR
ncbi:hypothetical protein F5879DRAFT_1054674 [Lentinula edodes]|nr:hypothetical protein F5879DRAFT_1054674 [Lentinula edodes]